MKIGIKQIQEIFLIMMKSVVKDESYEDSLIGSINSFMDTYSVVTKEKEKVVIEPWNIEGMLPLTRIMSLIHSLYDKDFKYENKDSQQE